MKLFLTECKNNLLRIVGEDKYKLIETDFIPNLDTNETFQNNNNFTENEEINQLTPMNKGN